MKPSAAFALVALATGLGACQSINHDAALAGSHAVARQAATAADPANEDRTANLDDFYRDKLGIDPRVLYAQRGEPVMPGPASAQDGSAMGN